MTQIVELPSGEEIEFPDEASDAQIKSFLNRNKPTRTPAQVSATQKALTIPQFRAPPVLPGGFNLPGGMTGRDISKPISDVALGAAQGIANMPIGLANLPMAAANLLPGVNLPLAKPFQFAPQNRLASLAEFGSLLAAPFGLGRAARFGLQSSIGKIPEMANALSKASTFMNSQKLTPMISRNVLLGASASPEEPLTGAALGGGLTAGGQLIGRGINALRPSQQLAGRIPSEELQRNLESAMGTETGLGRVIGSPELARFQENLLTKIPFSGMTKRMQETGKQVIQRGQSILDKMSGGKAPEEANEAVFSGLMKTFNERQAEKIAHYKNVDTLAEEAGVKIGLSSFAKQAKDYKGAIEKSDILDFEPQVKNLLSKIEKKKEAVLSLKDANLLKGKLSQYAEQSSSSPAARDRHIAGIFRNLSKSMKTDIGSSLEASGNDALKAAYKKAEESYAKDFSPFLDREIYKFISGRADPDTLLSSFLRQSRGADRSKLLDKLQKSLGTSKDKELLGYSYFSKAVDKEGKLDPRQLNTLIKNLGPNQFKVLVPSESLRRDLLNYSKLYQMNVESINMMVNPPTGQRVLDLLPAGITGGVTGYGLGVGGLSGALTGLAAPAVSANALTRLLTNERIRKSIVNKMLQQPQPWPTAQMGELAGRGAAINSLQDLEQ